VTVTNPPVPSLSRGAKALGLFLGALIPGLIAIFFIGYAPATEVNTVEGEAQIHFQADHRSVLLPGDCVNVRWEVGGIRAVYINDEPTIGSGAREFCVTPGEQPALQVHLQDGSLREYKLDITIVVRQAAFWFVVVLAAGLLIASGFVLIAPALGRWLGPVCPYAQRFARVMATMAFIILAIGIALELGLRFYFTQFGTERERVRYLYTGEEIRHQAAQLMPMPYVSYVPAPNYPDHNRLGYRGAEIDIPKPEGVFRIVALGGSTTYSTSTTWQESYPTQLESILREQYGYANVEVVNAGVPGYTSWDVLANFVFRVVELQPDLVLIYDGINDIQPRAVDAECYRGLNPLRGLSPTRGLWQRPEIPVQSALYRLLAISLGWMPDPSTLEGGFGDYPLRCNADFINDARIKDNAPVYFERNLRDLIVLAQANDMQVMFSTWTYNANGDPGAMPPAWRDAIVEHNDILRNLADEYGLPLYDLAATDFWETPEYWADVDPIHLAAPGAHEQARRYAAFMVEQELIPSN